MRLKTYFAPTVAEAMRRIRDDLGDDAVIVATESDAHGGGFRIVAAMESGDADEAVEARLGADTDDTLVEAIVDALRYHRVPEPIIAQLIDGAATAGAADPTTALADILKSRFQFRRLDMSEHAKPIMLVGPPGAGKTTTAVKLATRAAVAKRKVKVISTDTYRAGATDQLAAFANILDADLLTAECASTLARMVQPATRETTVVIDTAGANPFDGDDMARLGQLADSGAVEPVLVCPAGLDPDEAAEMAAAFRVLGVSRLIVTRLDMARRLGALLTSASAGGLSFAEVGYSPEIARGLMPLTPMTLARLIMRASDQHAANHIAYEVAS